MSRRPQKRSSKGAQARKKRGRSLRREVARPTLAWTRYGDEKLLGMRLCDLGLRLEDTPLRKRVDQLYRELDRRGLSFRPHVWLSDEWFTPVGVPGIAMPFYLAHPRLERLERAMMLEVEGGTKESCMKILRHEAGHAIQNAYRLNRRKDWREVFGRSGEPYPETYQPRPYSRRFVLHIDNYYAQAHPDEDFAETFAVWLTPNYPWRTRYKGWPALKKLEYIDRLMNEIAGRTPAVRTRRRPDALSTLRHTLGEHYARRQRRYELDRPDFYTRDLRRLFVEKGGARKGRKASAFLRRNRRDILRSVSRWTGAYQYTIDQVYTEMIQRCEELELRVPEGADETALKSEAAVLLTVQTMNFLHEGGHRIVL